MISTQMQYAMVVAAVCNRRISDRRNREDLVGCTGQQSFDLVCSTDGFEETRAEKGCGGTACVM